MASLRILFMRSRQKVMTSLALVYSCPSQWNSCPKKWRNRSLLYYYCRLFNSTLQKNTVSNSWLDPIRPTCDTEFIFVRLLICSLVFVQLIRFQVSQFDFCPEYVEKKPNNEIYIIYLASQNREYKYLTVYSYKYPSILDILNRPIRYMYF